MKGDYEGAAAQYQRAFESYEKVIGANHAVTKVNGLLLARMRFNQKLALMEKARGAKRYNLACYECLEGNLEEAKRLIAKHLSLHPEFKEQAVADADFTAIRAFIEAL